MIQIGNKELALFNCIVKKKKFNNQFPIILILNIYKYNILIL